MRLNQRTQALCEADRIVHPRDSQPRVLRFVHADLFRINESRVRRRLRSCRLQKTLAFVLGRKGRKDRCDGSARLGINRRLRTSHPATTSCPNRPVTLNSLALTRVDSRFQIAIHRRSDELNASPRSVIPSTANICDQSRHEEDFDSNSRSTGDFGGSICSSALSW